MPNIVFASNNISHWDGTIISTEAGKFDSTRVPYAMKFILGRTVASPVFTPVTGDDTWIHFRQFSEDVGYTAQGDLITCWDAAGNELFNMRKNFSTDSHQLVLWLYDGTSSIEVDQSPNFNEAVMNTVDIHYKITASVIELKLYANGTLAGSLNFAANPNSYGPPAYFTLSDAFIAAGTNMFVSEVFVADADTRNGRLNLLRPIANGAHADWFGEITVLADDDPTTGMTTILADQRQTLDLSTYVGAANISNLVIATQSYAGVNGPQNMRHTIRMSGVDYDGPSDIPLSDTLEFNATDYSENPATSAPWDSGDLATLELGFISKT